MLSTAVQIGVSFLNDSVQCCSQCIVGTETFKCYP